MSSKTMKEIKVKLLSANAVKPQKAHDTDVGYDCVVPKNYVIQSRATNKIPLGFALEMPTDYYCDVRGRSSMDLKGVAVRLGTVDSDYTGEVCAIIHNAKNSAVQIYKGDRICQIVFHKKDEVILTEMAEEEKIKETERADGGFGSTGT